MANAKKQIVVNVTTAMPFTAQQDAVMSTAFKALANADDAFKAAAETLHDAGIKAEMFYTLSTPDEKVMKERKAAFSEQSAAHVRKLACLAKFGDAGFKLMTMHPDLRPSTQKEEFRVIKAWVNMAVEKLARILQGIADSEKDKTGDATKRAATSLLEWLDENLAKLQKDVLVTKKQQDVSAADAALEIRALRKRLAELKPAK
jgi:hypothetical protein